MSTFRLKLGETIAVAREAKGMTLRELEAASGVSNALISQIETGKVRDPGFSVVIRIARGLGLSLDRCAKPYLAYLENKADILRGYSEKSQ